MSATVELNPALRLTRRYGERKPIEVATVLEVWTRGEA